MIFSLWSRSVPFSMSWIYFVFVPKDRVDVLRRLYYKTSYTTNKESMPHSIKVDLSLVVMILPPISSGDVDTSVTIRVIESKH